MTTLKYGAMRTIKYWQSGSYCKFIFITTITSIIAKNNITGKYCIISQALLLNTKC